MFPRRTHNAQGASPMGVRRSSARTWRRVHPALRPRDRVGHDGGSTTLAGRGEVHPVRGAASTDGGRPTGERRLSPITPVGTTGGARLVPVSRTVHRQGRREGPGSNLVLDLWVCRHRGCGSWGRRASAQVRPRVAVPSWQGTGLGTTAAGCGAGPSCTASSSSVPRRRLPVHRPVPTWIPRADLRAGALPAPGSLGFPRVIPRLCIGRSPAVTRGSGTVRARAATQRPGEDAGRGADQACRAVDLIRAVRSVTWL
jgi:hypothetical protein